MELLYAVNHKVDNEGKIHVGDFVHGEIDEFTTFFYWDSLVENAIVECSKNKISKEMTFNRNGENYRIKVDYNESEEWNLSYKIFKLS